MTTLKNVSPLGELDVPLLGRFLKAGEEFEVSDEIAEKLLPQAENYVPADDGAWAILAKLTGDPDDNQSEEQDGEPDGAVEETEGEPEAAAKPASKRVRHPAGS